jgi:hypothetical protein
VSLRPSLIKTFSAPCSQASHRGMNLILSSLGVPSIATTFSDFITWSWSWSSSCGRQSVDQWVWVSGLLLEPLTRFYLALLSSSDNYVVLLSMRPLWRENGSVIYCWIASGPCQSHHTWAEVPQNSRPYLTLSFETPPTWRAKFPYLYPPGTGWPSCFVPTMCFGPYGPSSCGIYSSHFLGAIVLQQIHCSFQVINCNIY